MNYELSASEFRVNFGLLKKSISYSRVVNAEIVDLKLSLRLFGASLPGVNWGLFRTSIGNAHVYATKIEGDFIVITLNDGEKIALSPEEPTLFLESMKEKTKLSPTQNIKETEHQNRSFKRLMYAQVLAVSIATIAFLGYFAWVYASLPEIVPVHFGFNGVANRWANKSELLWLAGAAALFPVINAVLALKFGKYERGIVLFLGAVFIAVTVLFFYTINTIALSA
jgi:hypothetical protein